MRDSLRPPKTVGFNTRVFVLRSCTIGGTLRKAAVGPACAADDMTAGWSAGSSLTTIGKTTEAAFFTGFGGWAFSAAVLAFVPRTVRLSTTPNDSIGERIGGGAEAWGVDGPGVDAGVGSGTFVSGGCKGAFGSRNTERRNGDSECSFQVSAVASWVPLEEASCDSKVALWDAVTVQ